MNYWIRAMVLTDRTDHLQDEDFDSLSSNAFSLRLLEKVGKHAIDKGEGNWFVSPLSLQIALGMLLNGAQGETADEICRMLGYGNGETAEVNQWCKLMLEQLPKLDKKTDLFGLGGGELPAKPKNVQAQRVGEIDMLVSWEADGAVGHNILWGYAPDKLYHSYLILGANEKNIGALTKGEPVYVRVDAFNENGITEGEVFAL